MAADIADPLGPRPDLGWGGGTNNCLPGYGSKKADRKRRVTRTVDDAMDLQRSGIRTTVRGAIPPQRVNCPFSRGTPSEHAVPCRGVPVVL